MTPKNFFLERIGMGLFVGMLAAFFAGVLPPGFQAHGQTATGEIVGTVKDSSGAVVPGVGLTITHRNSGQARRLITDSSGNYVAPSLPIGEYTIKAEMANFKTQIREGIVLQVGQQARVDLAMQLGEITEQVTVQESVPLLRTTNAEVSEVITNQRIVDLPLNGRQFVQLTTLSDNVYLTPQGTRGAALGQTGRQIVVAGQRAGHNMYYLDGVSITDQYFNNLVLSPSIDEIQEFKIQKSIYSAEFGGKASASVNAATKAGSNSLHGSLFEFIRNNVFDARNFFDTSVKPPYRQNQFGGTLGGHVKKDRTFFFLSYEGLRVRQALTRTFSLPTARVRSGDFSGLSTIYDPLSTDPATGRRQAFPGNRINRPLDPAAVAFLQKLPLPNLPGEVQNFVASPSLRDNHDEGTARVDQALGPRDNLFGRFTIADLITFQPYGSTQLNETLVPGFGYEITTYTRNVALNYTHIFTPSLIDEFRFGYLRVTGGQQSENQGVDFGAQNGIQGISRDLRKVGYPAINFSDAYSTAGDSSSLVTRRNNSFDFFDNLSWIRGTHSMKFGTYFYRLRFNPQDSPNARGAFVFSPRFSSSAAGLADGNSFADFLLGYPSNALGGIGRGEMDGRTLWTHLYAQDDWRARHNLTVNLGLRYEINGQMTDTGNRLSNIELNRFVVSSDSEGRIHPDANPLLPVIPVPYVSSKDAGYDHSLQLPNFHRIAPRIGFAWTPFGSEKTVMRAGYGLYFNQAAYSIQVALAQNLPFYFNKSVTTAADTRVPTLTTENILLAPGTGSIGGSSLDYNYRSEYAESWTLSVQQMLAANWSAQASYFGSKVVGADSSTFLNIPEPGPGPVDPRRPNPRLSGFKTIRWDGWSKYHSLSLKLEKRFSKGFTFDTNYTWSKSIDDASDPGGTAHESNIPQNVRNLAAEKGLSSFDHRHRFVFTYSYELPFGAGHTLNPGGWRGKLLEGWSVTGIGSFQSGAPITINLPNDNANIGAGPAQRPNLVSNPNANADRTAQRWFNTAAFQAPAPFTFGNAGRNIVFEAGEASVDFSLIKNTSLREGKRLEFRTEFFNLPNHTNFVGAPGRIAFTPNFGRLFNAGPSRQLQLALKLLF